jgi:hypothetical protein
MTTNISYATKHEFYYNQTVNDENWVGQQEIHTNIC